MLVDGVHRLQHVLPVELPFQREDGLAVAQPRVQVQVPALHQHVDVAVRDLTAEQRARTHSLNLGISAGTRRSWERAKIPT